MLELIVSCDVAMYIMRVAHSPVENSDDLGRRAMAVGVCSSHTIING